QSGRLRLRRTSRGGAARLAGCLEDYAFIGDALLRLYEATFQRRWLNTAEEIAATILEIFADSTPGGGGFFATAEDHETLIQRPRDWDDNAVPSGNSVAVELLLRLAVHTGKDSYRQPAVALLRKVAPLLEKHPAGFARLLGALDFHLSGAKEVAIVGEPGDPGFGALVKAANEAYVPNRVLAAGDGSDSSDLPLFQDRPVQTQQATAYVCENYACQAPVTTAEALRSLLA
ncbi:MAG TPA: thioredoxin domain-containing protein, partial [Chthonomonadaceae bacterium]|nr:thioredoxin domain-containing protein [Chthonomonadaceae bacterium]